MAGAVSTELTPRQRQIFDWVKAFIREHAMPPTVREIGNAFGIKSSSAFQLLKTLERKDYMRRRDRRARSLIVEDRKTRRARGIPVLERVPEGERDRSQIIAVPVVGAVAAGRPILAEENVIGELLVDAAMVRAGRFFGLEVSGDSMIGAGIRHGDTVLVRQQPLAESGDIVVAMIAGEATVKRLHLREDAIALRPENPAYQSIMVAPEDELRIAGKVVGVQHADILSK